MRPFFTEGHPAAAVLVAVTLAASVLVEWAVTLYERIGTEPAADRAALAAATLGEVALLRTGERPAEDRQTKWVLQGSVVVGLLLAWAGVVHLPGLAFQVRGWAPTLVGLALMWAGIGLRAWAIATLGRFFRRDIQVAADQVVVRDGPYAAIRHPAYAGNLLVYAGVGFVPGVW